MEKLNPKTKTIQAIQESFVTVVIMALFLLFQHWAGPELKNLQTSSILAFGTLAIFFLELPATAYINGMTRASGRTIPDLILAYIFWGVFRAALGIQIVSVGFVSHDLPTWAVASIGLLVLLKEIGSLSSFGMKYTFQPSKSYFYASRFVIACYCAIAMCAFQNLAADMFRGGFPVDGGAADWGGFAVMILVLLLMYTGTHPHQFFYVYNQNNSGGSLLILGPVILTVIPLFYNHGNYIQEMRSKVQCDATMDLSGQNLIRLKSDEWGILCKCKSIESLNLSDNKLTFMPDCLGEMDQLKSLIISKNKMSNFSLREFMKYPPRNLEVLDVRGNLLGEFSRGLSVLKKLRVLGISSTRGEHSDILEPRYIKRHMSRLQEIFTWKGNFSKEEEAEIQAALPNVYIQFEREESMSPILDF